MGNLTNCIAKAGKAIDEADRRNLLARYDAHIKDGMPASDAGELAIREVHGGLMDSLNQLADSAAGAGVQMLVAEKIPDQATTGQQQPDAAEQARLAALTPAAFAAEVMQLLGSSDAVYRAPRIPSTVKSVKKAVRIGVPNATFIGINVDPDQGLEFGEDFTAGSNTPEALASSNPMGEVFENVKYLGYSFTLPQPVGSKGDDPAPRFTIKVYQPSPNFPSGAVEVDVSGVGTGNNGALVYNAAAGFAAANGIPFRADSSGLKEFGAIRRTVTMANAAMRYGVQIVEPGERQLAPTKRLREAGIAPLTWENRGLGVTQRQAEMNDERNRANMANLLRAEATSVRQVIGAVLEQYGFDFVAGTFTKNGAPIDFGPQSPDVSALVEAGRSALSERGIVPENPVARADATVAERAAPPYGRASIARAVLVQSLAQTQGGAARREVLDATRQLLSQQLGRGETDLTNLWSQSGGKPPGAFTSLDKAIVAMRAAWGKAFTSNSENGSVVLVTQAEAIAMFKGKDGEAGAATAKGWFDPATGKVYVVWDMNTPDEIAGTFLHEFGVHKAAPEWLGSDLYNMLTTQLLADAQTDGADPRLREAFAQAQAAQAVATHPDALRHETLAYLAEMNPGDGLVVKLLDSFKGVLNALGFRLTRLESDTDLVLRVMRDALRSQARGNTGATTARPYQGGEQFSLFGLGKKPEPKPRAPAKQAPSRGDMRGADREWREQAQRRRDGTDKEQPGEWRIKFSQRVADMEAPLKQQAVDKPWTYSALANAVQNATGLPAKATVQQWRGWLDGAARRGDFKENERKWLGLDQWMDARGGTFTKEDLHNFISTNVVTVSSIDDDFGAADFASRTLHDSNTPEYRAALLDRVIDKHLSAMDSDENYGGEDDGEFDAAVFDNTFSTLEYERVEEIKGLIRRALAPWVAGESSLYAARVRATNAVQHYEAVSGLETPLEGPVGDEVIDPLWGELATELVDNGGEFADGRLSGDTPFERSKVLDSNYGALVLGGPATGYTQLVVDAELPAYAKKWEAIDNAVRRAWQGQKRDAPKRIFAGGGKVRAMTIEAYEQVLDSNADMLKKAIRGAKNANAPDVPSDLTFAQYKEALIRIERMKDDGLIFHDFEHFGRSNVVASARVDLRKDGAGRSVAFVNEIQSDWHKRGGKAGYVPKADRSPDAAAPAEAADAGPLSVEQWLDQNGPALSKSDRNKIKYRATMDIPSTAGMPLLLAAMVDAYVAYAAQTKGLKSAAYDSDAPVPDGPFKSEWAMVGFRRALEWAVQKGADVIALPKTPDQVASIENWGEMKKTQDESGATKYTVKQGKRVVDVTGIVRVATRRGPQEFEKYMKRAFGVGLSDITLDNGEVVQGFEITDTVSQSVREHGQPLWSQRTPGQKVLMGKTGMPIDERPLLSRIRDGIRDRWQRAMAEWHDGTDERIQAIADRFRGVSAAEEAVERAIGRKLDANERSYVMMRMNLGLPSIMDAVLQYGAPRLEDQTWTQWADVEVNGVVTEVVESAPSRGEAKAALEAKHPGATVTLKSKPAQPVPGLPEKSGMTGGTHGVFVRNEQTKGLLDALKPVADDLNGWLAWMVVQRAKRTTAQGKENLLTDVDIAEGDALADTPEKLAAFQQAAEDYTKIKTAILDMAEQAGVISREAREAWDHAEYIPFFRQDADGKIKGPRNTKRPTDNRPGVRVLKGGEQALADPLGNIVQNFAKLIDSSMKNIALERLVTTLSLNRDNADQIRGVLSGFPTVSQTQIQRAFARVGLYDRSTNTFTQGDAEFSRADLRQALRDAGIASDQINKAMGTQDADSIFFEKLHLEVTKALVPMSAVIKQLLDDGVPQAVIDGMPASALKGLREMMAFAIPKGPDVFTVLRQGKVHSYRATDPLLLRSLAGMLPRQRGIINKILSGPARFLTGMITRDPVFMVRNLTRDVLQNWTIAEIPYNPVASTVSGVVRSMMETGGAIDMMFAGASFHRGHAQVHDPEATANAVRRVLRAKGMNRAQVDSAVAKFSRSIIDAGPNMLAAWDRVGSAVENATREAVFEAAIRAGLTRAEASYMARDVLDFGLRGDSGVINWLADVLPFFNARVQGMYKLYRAGAIPGMGPKMRAAVIGRGMALASFSVGLMALNLALFKAGYEELEEWDKDTYWHIAPGTVAHVRIPKPFEIGLLFGTIPERLMRAIQGAATGYEEGDTLAKSARAVYGGVWNTLGMNPIPQAVLPLAELAANKSAFTGRPIENLGDEKKPKADVGEWYTSPIAKAAAGGMSDLLQMAGFSPRAGLSAKQMEHLWRGYTGTIGGYALATADTIVNQSTDSPVTADDWTDWAMSVAPADIPFIPGRSTRPIADVLERGDWMDGGTPRNFQQSKDFYTLQQDITVMAMGVKAMLQQAQTAEADGDYAARDRLQAEAQERFERNAGTLGEMEDARTKSGKLDARVMGGVRFDHQTAMNKAVTELRESRDQIELIMTNPDLSRVEQRRQIEVIAAARKVTMQTMLDRIRASQRSAAGAGGQGGGGGGGSYDSKDRAKISNILEANRSKDFVKRILNPESSPRLDLGNGDYASHKMGSAEADGQFYAYPQVQRDGEVLKDFGKDAFRRAMKTGDVIRFDTEAEAQEFATKYKVMWEDDDVD